MERIMTLLEVYSLEVSGGLVLVSLLLLLLNLIGQVRIGRIKKDYNRLVRDVDGENLEELVLRLGGDLDLVNDELRGIKGELTGLNRDLRSALQKTAIYRYDAFEDLGSKQSYSLVLLTKEDNGFILTSIFNRNYSNSYIKPIENGKSQYTLSEEEELVLKKVLG